MFVKLKIQKLQLFFILFLFGLNVKILNSVHKLIHIFQAKSRLVEVIHNFLNERIILASKVISENACQKIKDGDVIMVYAW